MSLADLLKSDVLAMLSTSEFAETITYQAMGQAPKEIPAQVFRTEHLELSDPGRREIWISKDAAQGIARVTLGGDRVWLKFRTSDPELTEMRVSQVIEDDQALWVLELKK